jgi:LacI family transcriptional regulator
VTRRATAQDVADAAGVSRSAVSLVLNGHGAGNISAVKQEAIREAARALRYTPDAVALSLRKQRTRTIGVLTWFGQAGIPGALLGGLSQAAARAGYLLLTVNAVQRPELVNALLDRRVDGFVVLSPELADYQLPETLDAVPTVLLNCADSSRPRTSVVPDELAAGASAARLLVEAGHRRIGVLAHPADTLQAERRIRGIQRELAAAGLPEPLVVATGRDIDAGQQAACTLLSARNPPSGLICTHERLAIGAMLAAAQHGVSVPDRLSLVSLDDGEDLAVRLWPSLAVVQRPAGAMAESALDLLIGMFGEEPPPPRQLSFACRVRAGESVRPPFG